MMAIDDRSLRQETLQWLFAARRHMQLDNHRLAQELLNACLVREPDNLIVADAWARNWAMYQGTVPRRPVADRIGRVLGRSSPATVEEAVRRLLRRPWDERLMLRLLDLLTVDHSSEEVAWLLADAFAQVMTDSPEILQRAARLAEACARFPRALELWGAIAERHPEHPDAREALARLQRLFGDGLLPGAGAAGDLSDSESAQDEWLGRLQARARRAQEEAERDASERNLRTAAQIEQHHRDAAIEIYRERARRYPEDIGVWHRWVRLLCESNRWDAVRSELEACRLIPGDPFLLACRAESRQRQRDFEGAMADYAVLLDCDDGPLPVSDWAARSMEQAGVLAESLQQWALAEAFWGWLAGAFPAEAKWKSRLDKVRRMRHKGE